MNREQLHAFIAFTEREANRAAYGKLYGDILNDLLGLVICQQRDGLSDYEIQALAKSMFKDYVAQYLPDVARQAAEYADERDAEQHRLQVQSSENEHRRLERLREEREAREKAASEAEAARYSKAKAEEAALQAKLAEIRAQELRELQDRM